MIAVVDASAAVKLVLNEQHSEVVRRLWDEQLVLLAPTIVLPAVAAAISAARRAGRIDDRLAARAHEAWVVVADEIDLLSIDPALAALARALAESRRLRGMDALYLATALMVGEGTQTALLTFDGNQRDAVADDGIGLLPAQVE